ncbi:MAG: FtsX-like permease family protein [Cytophagales bacterium]
MNIKAIILPKISFQSKLIFSTLTLLFSTIITFVIFAFLTEFYTQKLLEKENHLYFSLSKSIGIGNTILGRTSSFNEEEIKGLKEQAFCSELRFIKKAKFKCIAGFFEQKQFSSEIILESIPNSMMDGPVYRFYWEEGQDEVPIIISAEFLQLYNFVYAPIAGLPPVSIENLSMIPIEISLIANGKRKSMKAEIIGLTDRFSGLYVPESFLNWANTYFTGSASSRRDKAVLKVNPAYISEFEDYVISEALIVNEENLRMGKTASLIYPLSAGLLLIACVFIILSVSNFWLHWKWLLERQKENIQILYFNGFHPKYIAKQTFKYLIPIPGLAFVLSILFGILIWKILQPYTLSVLNLDYAALPVFAIALVSSVYTLIFLSIYFALWRFCRAIYI